VLGFLWQRFARWILRAAPSSAGVVTHYTVVRSVGDGILRGHCTNSAPRIHESGNGVCQGLAVETYHGSRAIGQVELADASDRGADPARCGRIVLAPSGHSQNLEAAPHQLISCSRSCDSYSLPNSCEPSPQYSCRYSCGRPEPNRWRNRGCISEFWRGKYSVREEKSSIPIRRLGRLGNRCARFSLLPAQGGGRAAS
jgi:hypothetical protein